MSVLTILAILASLQMLLIMGLRHRVRALECYIGYRLQTDGDLKETHAFSHKMAIEGIAARTLRYNRILHNMPFQQKVEKLKREGII